MNNETSNTTEIAEPVVVYCLSIDMIKSTEIGLSLLPWKLKKFNRALINQILPHLKALELEHAVVKFTGDGWLIMSPTAGFKLCYLAMIFRHGFRNEMSKLSNIALD